MQSTYLLHNAHCTTIIRSCFNIMELLLRKIVCVAKLGRALILACFLGQNIWNCLNSRRIFEHNNPLTKKLVSKGRRSRGRKNTSYFQHKKFLIGWWFWDFFLIHNEIQVTSVPYEKNSTVILVELMSYQLITAVVADINAM